MTTLAAEGWTPVTAEQSRNGYTWRVWVRPDAPGWTFVEAREEAGRMHAGGVYAMPLEEGEELSAVSGGGERKRHIAAPALGTGETGFHPSEH